MSMVSRELRIIAGHQVSEDKSANRIQDIVDSAPYADYYCNVSGHFSLIPLDTHLAICYNPSMIRSQIYLGGDGMKKLIRMRLPSRRVYLL